MKFGRTVTVVPAAIVVTSAVAVHLSLRRARTALDRLTAPPRFSSAARSGESLERHGSAGPPAPRAVPDVVEPDGRRRVRTSVPGQREHFPMRVAAR